MNDEVLSSICKRVADEAFARKLGMRLVELEPGHAIVEMAPQEDTTNIFGMTHGGAIFSLIDEAFQLSCNSHGTVAVALNMTITYHQPPDRMSILRAESTEIHLSLKTATYEIKVTDENGALISSCQALAYRKGIRLPFLDEKF
ncbi:MAG: PaaI family thioesterase [Deltaproteobacteria bacterium]|nr:PaaI family thioesterase [Deltaproteobacteria bacterium]MBW2117447.1 PaaI family thioesterase [Deltaproteobacteria bacterium]MBW2343873.1 PaaI family thioesterase [Deltaproteobacteria bacterium]